jgi:hypothetical protein
MSLCEERRVQRVLAKYAGCSRYNLVLSLSPAVFGQVVSCERQSMRLLREHPAYFASILVPFPHREKCSLTQEQTKRHRQLMSSKTSITGGLGEHVIQQEGRGAGGTTGEDGGGAWLGRGGKV